MLTCTACGHANTAQSNFCSHCGEKLVVDGSASETTSVISAVALEDALSGEITTADEAAISDLPVGSVLLVVRRGSRHERFLLDGERTIAGRHPGADIFLDDVTVSRHHAEFVIEHGQITLRDLGSLNGTYVNRQPLEAPITLRTGDEVQIGKFRMICFVSPRGLG